MQVSRFWIQLPPRSRVEVMIYCIFWPPWESAVGGWRDTPTLGAYSCYLSSVLYTVLYAGINAQNTSEVLGWLGEVTRRVTRSNMDFYFEIV